MTEPEQVDPWAMVEWLEPGLRAARPDVSAVAAGARYLATDEDKTYLSDGLTWIEIMEDRWEVTDAMRAAYKRWHLAVQGSPAPEGSVDSDLRAMHREGLL